MNIYIIHAHKHTYLCTLKAASQNAFHIFLVAYYYSMCVCMRLRVCMWKMLSQMLISVVYDLSIIFPFFVPFLLNILAVASSYGWCCKCQQLNSWLWRRAAVWGCSGFHMINKAAGRMQFKIKVDNLPSMKSTNLQNALCNREWDGNMERTKEHGTMQRTDESRRRKEEKKEQTNKQYKIATVHFVYCLVYNLIHWA